MMTTREVAAYLRVKQRKVYELVREGGIPCTRVTGKWLFPRQLIERWIAIGTEGPGREANRPAPIIGGSRDPLLDWAARESGSGLALIAGGSLDGVRRLAEGGVMLAGLHVYEPGSGGYNVHLASELPAARGLVLLEWAWREQGLLVPPRNPHSVTGIGDVVRAKLRVIRRQSEAGSRLLFDHLCIEAGISESDLMLTMSEASTGHELALAVRNGEADVGLGARAAASQLGLGFVPLMRERFDLLLARRDYFEEPVQRLLRFARGERFGARAAELTGYDVSGLGRVHYNSR